MDNCFNKVSSSFDPINPKLFPGHRCYESRPLELNHEVTLYRVYTRELDGELYTE